MQTAEVIQLPTPEVGYQLNPELHTRKRGNGRAIAVAKFRELADKLESGELDGARVQWLDTHGLRVEIEVDGEIRQYDLSKDTPPEGEHQPISGLEFVTRTAWREDGAGTVQIVGMTIEEEER
jgi:hypothetical protein